MAVEITRKDLTPAQVRLAAEKTRDARAARRMLAIALVLEGVERKTAAETCGLDRQTLRDWVDRYNTEGLTGLANRPSAGRRSRLSVEQKAELAAWWRPVPTASAKDMRDPVMIATARRVWWAIHFPRTRPCSAEDLDLFRDWCAAA